ncbi:TIGR00282 family metallophosphoesterase [Candidatus Saganbacteria bacterium]|nr:TIGR00282 family metallophosphoesterase [Candidatus Saganbacteria bacterium]
MNILFIGDIIGSYGRAVLKKVLPDVKSEYSIDLTVANGENSAHGYSITEKIYNELLDSGIDIITMGNHIFEKKEVITKIATFDRMVRPANFPQGTPGLDHLVLEWDGIKVGIINLLGRVFLQCMDCPFQAVEKILPEVKKQTDIILVDIHAEATSEKCAMGYFLDSRVSAVVGTHTHVMTADERILQGGTAFISDVGMVGAQDSIIGMSKEQIIKRFITQMPEKFEPTTYGPGLFNAVVITIDKKSGKALDIKRIFKITDALKLKEA